MDAGGREGWARVDAAGFLREMHETLGAGIYQHRRPLQSSPFCRRVSGTSGRRLDTQRAICSSDSPHVSIYNPGLLRQVLLGLCYSWRSYSSVGLLWSASESAISESSRHIACKLGAILLFRIAGKKGKDWRRSEVKTWAPMMSGPWPLARG